MEDVISLRPTRGRTIAAVILTVVFLVAFATAFYFYDGVGMVSGLLAGLPSGTTPPATAPAPASAPSVLATTTVDGGLVLPEGVTRGDAQRMYAEQLSSQANIVKLANGGITRFDYGKAVTSAVDARVPITVTFKDATSASGELGLTRRADKWYFAYVRSGRTVSVGGPADPVGDSAASAAPPKPSSVDTDVLNTVLAQQVSSQDVLADIVSGEYPRVTIDSVTRGLGTATLGITLHGLAGSTKGEVLCISKDIDGTPTWFVTSFDRVE